MKSRTLRDVEAPRQRARGALAIHSAGSESGASSGSGGFESGNPSVVVVEPAILVAGSAAVDLERLAELPIARLTSYIEVRYHAKLRRELAELVALSRNVERDHANTPSWPRGLAKLLHEMEEAAADHLAKEEQILFPMIRSGRGAGASGPVHAMEREHGDDGRALARLRDMTSGLVAPPGACTGWQQLYLWLRRFSDELVEHMYIEDNILFPRALCGDVEAS
jgi:regulator of cell morphogenesis and NO signaling